MNWLEIALFALAVLFSVGFSSERRARLRHQQQAEILENIIEEEYSWQLKKAKAKQCR